MVQGKMVAITSKSDGPFLCSANARPDPPALKFTAPFLSAQLLTGHKLVCCGLCFSEADLPAESQCQS